jgi:hypothetical protein
MRLFRSLKPSALLVGLLGGVGLWTLVWNSPAALSASFGARWALGLSNIPVWVPDPWGSAAYWLTLIRPGDLAAIAGLAVLCTSLAQCALVLTSLSTAQTDPPISADPSRAVVIGRTDDHSQNRPTGR